MRKALALNEMERSEIEVAWLVQSQDSHAKAPARNEVAWLVQSQNGHAKSASPQRDGAKRKWRWFATRLPSLHSSPWANLAWVLQGFLRSQKFP